MTRHGRYAGPPGDIREYLLPRDFDDWDEAWARALGGKPEPLTAAERKLLKLDGPARARETDMSPEAVAERAEKKRRQAEAIAYVASYSGSWGLPLDIRANPKWGTKYLKLSEAQVDALLKGRDRDLERIEQARINTELWQDEEYQRHERERTEAPQAPELAPQSAPRTSMGSNPEDGWYTVDGQPWKVQWNRERTRKYAKRLVLGDPAAVREPGDRVAPGSWEYVPGGLSIIARSGEPMTIEQAEAFGRHYGVCGICGQTLTDEKSIARGIGPICAGRLL